jgi:hypothetical protein
MARRDKLIAFLETEMQLLRDRIATLESKGWPTPVAPGKGQGEPDAIEVELARNKAKVAEIEAHLRDLKQEA